MCVASKGYRGNFCTLCSILLWTCETALKKRHQAPSQFPPQSQPPALDCPLATPCHGGRSIVAHRIPLDGHTVVCFSSRSPPLTDTRVVSVFCLYKRHTTDTGYLMPVGLYSYSNGISGFKGRGICNFSFLITRPIEMQSPCRKVNDYR